MVMVNCILLLLAGSGGRDLSGNKRTAAQSFDQELTRTNAAIASNCNAKFNDKDGADAGEAWKKGKPIRWADTTAYFPISVK